MNMSARKPVIDEHYDDKDNIVVYFERSCVKRGKCKHTIHYLHGNVIQILRIRCLVLSKAILWSLVLLYLCARVVWRLPPRSALLSTALLQAAVTSQTNNNRWSGYIAHHWTMTIELKLNRRHIRTVSVCCTPVYQVSGPWYEPDRSPLDSTWCVISLQPLQRTCSCNC